MHVPLQANKLPETDTVLDFAWIELTNQCNLHCGHCYSDSSPDSGYRDLLNPDQYFSLLEDLSRLKCRSVQFIGGEPTLNKNLLEFISHARYLGFEFVEVFTNLVSLSEKLLQGFVDHQVAVATSFYAGNANIHDSITNRKGSFDRTVQNIKRVVDAGLRIRAGVIVMDINRDETDAAVQLLRSLGVENVGFDHVRSFGRAGADSQCEMSDLCGSCADKIISIGPDGLVSPCNMARRWSIGSVFEKSLEEIVNSQVVEETRHQIKKAVLGKSETVMICDPKTCGPYSYCCPSTQSCNPCAPNSCSPCYPKG